MTETAKTVGASEEKSGPSSSLKKSALSAAAAKEWTAATSGFVGQKSKPLITLDLPKKDEKTETNATTTKIDAPTGFVFGSKLSSRVSNATTSDQDSQPKDVQSIFKQVANSASFLNPTSGIKKFEAEKPENTSQPQPTEPVETLTGEEGEKNLLHISCKFFAFDKETKTWQERGLGTLRINESLENPQNYRIVGRSTGNQRVCVNTKIFSEMLVEKISDKRLKISAVNPDSEIPQLFVIHASEASIQQLNKQLDHLMPKVKAATRKRRLEADEGEEVPKPKNPPPVDKQTTEELQKTDESTDK
ncbi:Ran-binding protein 3 [Aphelenchoides besseyi]|nr:Ran-binding protein 3 [Aphelenchoides besseyi]KAI6211681.1 Ran-binding protein 3 [Aphelenchoides besseyi]